MRNNIQRFFNFKKEIGWAEVISLLAFIFSLFAYFKNETDNISIKTKTPISSLYTEKNKNIYFIYCRANIINNGNKPVTLLGFYPHEKLGLSLVAKNGSKHLSKEYIPYEIFQIPDSVLMDDLFRHQEQLTSFKNQGLEKLSLMNKIIAPGEAYLLNIGIKYYLPDTMDTKYTTLIFSGQLDFSNGETFLFGAGGDIIYQRD